MKNKKVLFAAIAVLAAALILGAVLFLSSHIFVDGACFSKNSTVLDLTEHDLTEEEYLQLCNAYPNTQILWTVPFQGSRYPMDTTSITVTALTQADVQTLDQLKQLQQVDATGCTDYGALIALQQHRPDCQVLYTVPLCGTTCSSTAKELTVQNATAAELGDALSLLPNLKNLTLEGTLPQPDQLLRLKHSFPEVQMHFTQTIAGREFPSQVSLLDLSGSDVTAAELTQALPLLDQVQEVNLTDTPLTDSEKKELIRQFPEVFFLCTLDFAGIPCSTETTEIDISGRSITVEEAESLIPCFPKLKKLIMSHCGIDDEAMDALNRSHPDVSIVWTLQIGLVTLRTDATYFYPAAISEFNLPSNEQLQKLRYCTEMVAIDVGHSKATDCEWVRYLPKLKYLIIADTNITDLSPLEQAKELVYLEAFSLDLTDYSPLLGCTSLQDLNIGDTFADPAPLTQMTWLHMLSWHGAVEDPELKDKALALENQLSDTVIILDSPRNINPQWRATPHYFVFRDMIGGLFFNQDYIKRYWDNDSANKILKCDRSSVFAGDLMAEIVRYYIDNDLPISTIRNVGSEKAEILYQSLLNVQP